MLEIPIYIWLMLGPIGKAEVIVNGYKIYFAQNEWCKKAKHLIVYEGIKVQVQYTCLWKSASYKEEELCENGGRYLAQNIP